MSIRKSKNVIEDEFNLFLNRLRNRNYRKNYFIFITIFFLIVSTGYLLYWNYIFRGIEFTTIDSNTTFELNGSNITINQESLLYDNNILIPRDSAGIDEIYSHNCNNMKYFYTSIGNFNTYTSKYIEPSASIESKITNNIRENLGGFISIHNHQDPIIDSDESIDISFYVYLTGDINNYLGCYLILADDLNKIMYIIRFQLSEQDDQIPKITTNIKQNLDCNDYEYIIYNLYEDDINVTSKDVWRNVRINDVYSKIKKFSNIGALRFKGLLFHYGTTDKSLNKNSQLLIDDFKLYTRPRYTSNFNGWYDENGHKVDSYKFNISYEIIMLRDYFNISNDNIIYSNIELYIYNYLNITKLSANPTEINDYNIATNLLTYSCIIDINQESDLKIINITYMGDEAILIKGNKLSYPIPFPYTYLGKRLQYKPYADYSIIAEHYDNEWERVDLENYKYFDNFVIQSKKGLFVF